MFLFYIFLFILGCAFGSFLGLLIDRLSKNESIFISRSKCESCKKKLGFFDLMPVFSFLLLKGKCRYCHSTIPQRLFWIELLTGVVFPLLFYLLNQGEFFIPTFIFYLIFSCCLIVIFFSDLKYQIIPDEVNLVLLFSSLVYKGFFNQQVFVSSFFSGLILLAILLILFIATKGKGMGMGDIKFSFVLGFVLGFPKSLVALYLAFLTGGIISTILIIWGKKKLSKDTIPFGPFLVIGSILSFLLTKYIQNFLGL